MIVHNSNGKPEEMYVVEQFVIKQNYDSPTFLQITISIPTHSLSPNVKVEPLFKLSFVSAHLPPNKILKLKYLATLKRILAYSAERNQTA